MWLSSNYFNLFPQKYYDQYFQQQLKAVSIMSFPFNFSPYTRLLCCAIWVSFLFHSPITQAQGNNSKNLINEASLSEHELLEQADNLLADDKLAAKALALNAVELAKQNNNPRVMAKSYKLLARIAQSLDDWTTAIEYYAQPTIIYAAIDDQTELIAAYVDHIKALLSTKQYALAEQKITQAGNIAVEFGDDFHLGLINMVSGDSHYKQKRFLLAIEQFKRALSRFKGADKDTIKKLAQVNRKLAECNKRLGNKEQTTYFYKQSLDLYSQIGYEKSMAKILSTLADAERNLGHYEIALNYSLRGLELYQKIDDTLGYAKALIGAGIIYRQIGRYETSLKHIQQAYQFFKEHDKANDLSNASNQIGLLYSKLKQFEQARSYYLLTINMAENLVEQDNLASALRELAVIDLNAKKYHSAMEMAHKAHNIYLANKNTDKSSITARIIGDIYSAQQNKSQAKRYYQEALDAASAVENTLYKIKAQIALGALLVGKDNDTSIKLLNNALSLSSQNNISSEMFYAFQALRLAEKSRGNFLEALRYAEQEINLSAVIQTEREENQLIIAKANLYSHKIEMELASLREKARLSELELTQKNNEVEIAEQNQQIYQLQSIKNRYASFTLFSLLTICFMAALFIYKRFIDSRKKNEELDYLATHDPLTDCFNRRAMLDVLTTDFQRADQLRDYCIIMADIDYFKAINDKHGHSVGDAVIQSVSECLKSSVRDTDIVSRFGGEEFCIILPNVAKQQALNIAEKMRIKIESQRINGINVTCSFGLSSIQFGAMESKALIDQADLALYQSKNNGRNQVTLYSGSLCM